MEITLDRDYPLDVDEVRAWRLLSDIPAMAACMPGAAITEQIDERRWKGTVKVKVGPASAAFAGEIELLEIDATGRTVRLHGKGADRGGSSASMNRKISWNSSSQPRIRSPWIPAGSTWRESASCARTSTSFARCWWRRPAASGYAAQ